MTAWTSLLSSPLRTAAGLVLAALLSLGPAATLARAQVAGLRSNSSAIRAAFRPVVAQPSQSTVRVRCDGKIVALGTVVAADGWIVTKYSELKGPVVCLFKDGKELSAQVVGVHDRYDLAMLKVPAGNLQPVQWGDVKSALVGNWVATPGSGDEPVAVGVVSVAARKTSLRDLPPSANSGFLGIMLEAAEKGVKIADVVKDSAAAKAGLKANDAILSIAGKVIPDPETLMDTVGRFKPGEVITVKVKRGEAELELKATLGKRPSDGRSDFQNHLGGDLSNRRGGFPSVLQHDTVLRPNECGGPLVDLDGKVVGINIARAGRTETYAVPADAVLALLADLKSGKLKPEEKLTIDRARADLEKAETARIAAEKRLKESRAALAEAEKAAAKLKEEGTPAAKEVLAKVARARSEAEKAEAARTEAEKRLKAGRSALVEAELAASKLKKEK